MAALTAVSITLPAFPRYVLVEFPPVTTQIWQYVSANPVLDRKAWHAFSAMQR